MLEINKIYNMDCLEGMKQLEDNSVDLIVSDPPYGYSFMSKEWDKWDILPEVETLKECLRVLKAGAFSFWLMTPRQDSQAEFIMRLKQAGFNIGFSPIYWAYLTGFPKAGNISKMVDKRQGVEGEVIGQKSAGLGTGKTYVFTEENKTEGVVDVTIPSSSKAKALDGSYTGLQLKPAVEIIIVAMKPLSEKSYIDQALKNRKGITWLDDCRISYESEADKESARFGSQTDIRGNNYGTNKPSKGNILATNVLSSSKGRFPANLLVSDNALDDGKITKSPNEERLRPLDYENTSYKIKGGGTFMQAYGDSGYLSRYFDLDKWFEERIKKLPKEIKKTFPFLFVAKPSSSEKQKDLGFYEIDDTDEYSGKFPQSKADRLKCNHPTVKPIKLFSYLITMGSRENDLVLDPYIGSGTLGISARLTTRNFIGFEKEKEYFEIAEARVKKYMQQTKILDF